MAGAEGEASAAAPRRRAGRPPSRARKDYLRRTPAPVVPSVAAGAERMRSFARGLPDDLVSGFRSGRELALGPTTFDRPVFAVGMGGSAAAADLLRVLTDEESSATLTVVRGPDLPRAAGKRAHVIVLSYSGETPEAVRAYALARARGASTTVVASGGRLAEEAEDAGVPVLRVPPGLPPRAAVGHLFGGMLGLFDAAFGESNERRLSTSAEALRSRLGALASPRGPAASLARAVGDRYPIVLAERSFAPLARRWKSQIEENAKRLAGTEELPEAMHNAVVGWASLRRPEAGRLTLVSLDWPGGGALVRAAADHLLKTARSRGARAVTARLGDEDRLGALVYGVGLGDHVALELARRRRVDPYPIEAIVRARAVLNARRGPAAS